MEKILVSACLLGENCKYSGGSNYSEAAAALSERYELIPVCPELMGGLSVPRPPCERRGGSVFSDAPDGIKDVTEEFERGARLCVQKAEENGVRLAVLKALSPSCGSSGIYDGSFSHTVIPGEGVTAEMLRKNGVKVISENEL